MVEIPEEWVEAVWVKWMAHVDESHRELFGTPLHPISDVDKRRQEKAIRAALSALPVAEMVEAIQGLFARGFVDAGLRGHDEWTYEFTERVKPLRALLSLFPSPSKEKGERK